MTPSETLRHRSGVSTFIAFFVAILIAAYGNAMVGLVARRERFVAEGVDAIVPSPVYLWTGRSLFWGGIVAISVLVVFVVLGRPLPLIG